MQIIGAQVAQVVSVALIELATLVCAASNSSSGAPVCPGQPERHLAAAGEQLCSTRLSLAADYWLLTTDSYVLAACAGSKRVPVNNKGKSGAMK